MNRPDAEQVLACALAVDRDLEVLRRFPTTVLCSCRADGEAVDENCEQCAGTGWVEADPLRGWTAAETGGVTPMEKTR